METPEFVQNHSNSNRLILPKCKNNNANINETGFIKKYHFSKKINKPNRYPKYNRKFGGSCIAKKPKKTKLEKSSEKLIRPTEEVALTKFQWFKSWFV